MKNTKLSKSILKEIVKECLIEILAEGLVKDSATSKSQSLKESISSYNGDTRKESRRRKPSYLDSIKFDEKSDSRKVKNQNLDKIAAGVTDDPILSEMLMDTAHTTLQAQIAADSKKSYVPPGSGDEAQRIVESSQPEELFGGASSKWASLAFGG